jgi:hypothetical protein
MVVLKIMLLFTFGLLIGFILKKLQWLLFLLIVVLVSTALFLIGYLIATLVFSLVLFQTYLSFLYGAAFVIGIWVGYKNTELKMPS